MALAKPDCKFKFKGGRLFEDLTLVKACSPYNLKGGIDILENVTVTIEPGVEVRFADRDWLEVAAASTKGGRLIAKGTAEEPIVLTSDDPETANAESWFGLWFASGTRDSILSHVIIRAGGGNNIYIHPPLLQGCLTITDVSDGALILEDVRLEGCINAGVVLRKSRPVLHKIVMDGVPTGFLLEGVDPKAIPNDVQYERVTKHIVEGRSTL